MQEKTSPWPYVEGRSEERSLVKTCSRLPLWSPRSLFHWYVFDMLVMSVGSCVFFHHAEWLGGPRTICSIILPCGSEPQSLRRPSFLSKLRAEPPVQDGR